MLYKTLISAIVLYAGDTWILFQEDVSMIDPLGTKILRKIFGPTHASGM
jgi:hypothetical protein